jgi:PhoPQ-activated pathogenicity-related protein
MKNWKLPLVPVLTLVVALACLSRAHAEKPAGSASGGPLFEYVARADLSFTYNERFSGRAGDTEYVELTVTSQTWRGIAWKHQLFIVRPSTLDPNATHGLLVIAGSGWKDEYSQPATHDTLPKNAALYTSLAERLRTPVAVVLQVPFQPLFDGLTEDWLISLTFDRYMETGDSDWPLLLPMVKSSVRAMDVVQEYVKQNWGVSLETFTVTGASKRGWTTWLTGVVDPRATAIAPMVIDVLNMAPQMRHAQALWGAPSDKVEPYTARGLLDRLATPEGRELLQIVDPYSYRTALTQPKLIVNGTNDDYWPVDAVNLYWKELPGEKYILYVPNNSHSLKDYGRVTGSVLALHEHQAGTKRLPEFDWTFTEDEQAVAISVRASPRPDLMRIWSSESMTADFRQARWSAELLGVATERAQYRMPRTQGHRAFFVEAEFRDGRTLPLFLSTTVRTVPPRNRASIAGGQ